MTRSHFLDQLRRGLAGLPPQDIADFIADYNAHFDEGLAKGRGEDEIAHSLGDPMRLARELRAEAQVRAWEEQPSPRNFFAVLFAFIGLAALDFIVMLPLLGWLALFGLITVIICIGMMLAGLVAVLSVLDFHAFSNVASGVSRFFAGLALIGLGTGIGASLLLFAQWVAGLLAKFARLHYRLLKQADHSTQ
jgi:uncharacterized membrane protein